MQVCKKILLIYILAGLIPMIACSQVPPGYYNGTEGLYGEELKSALHNIIDEHDEYSYSDLRDFILAETDEDPENNENIILLYTGRSQDKGTFGGGVNEWNREHVWAKSHGDFGNDPPCGTDAHMVRPTDASVNADRGNKDFDEGGQQHPEASGCYYTAYTWEPRDEVKGDVARMILYMDVRYEGDNGEPDLTVVDAVNTAPAPEHGRLSTLLEWHEIDPPDAFEINRNNVVYSYQGNRNPFVDHPDFVNNIWGETANIFEATLALDPICFPNPVQSKLHIRLNIQLHGRIYYQVYDLLGIELSTGQFDASEEGMINCSLFPEGIYILKLAHEQSGLSSVSSFIKYE